MTNWLGRVHETIPSATTYDIASKAATKATDDKLTSVLKKAKSGDTFKHEGKTYYVAKEKDFDWGKAKTFRKSQTIPEANVVIAKGGEEVETKHKDGKETKATAKKGDYIVTWKDEDKGVLTPEQFAKAWEKAPNGGYRATNWGKAVPVKRNTVFLAPWGVAQFIPKGGYAFKSGALGEFYGNRKEAFESTYGEEAPETKEKPTSAKKPTTTDAVEKPGKVKYQRKSIQHPNHSMVSKDGYLAPAGYYGSKNTMKAKAYAIHDAYGNHIGDIYNVQHIHERLNKARNLAISHTPVERWKSRSPDGRDLNHYLSGGMKTQQDAIDMLVHASKSDAKKDKRGTSA